MTIFNEAKNTYRSSIEQSIKFSGKDHEFYTSVKAQFLSAILKQHFSNTKTLNLLDVGCGHGFIHPYLEQAGCNIVGVEMAKEVLELAKLANPNVSYIGHDGKTLPFEDEKFDIAIAICVMHHVPPTEWNQFLIEMKRVIKPGGVMVIFEHNPLNPLTRYVVSQNKLDKDAVLLTYSNLEKLALKSGFKTASSKFILFTPFSNRFFRGIDKFFSWCPLGAQYYTIATR